MKKQFQDNRNGFREYSNDIVEFGGPELLKPHFSICQTVPLDVLPVVKYSDSLSLRAPFPNKQTTMLQ